MTLKSSDRFTGIKPTAEEISQNNCAAELMWQTNLTIVILTSLIGFMSQSLLIFI